MVLVMILYDILLVALFIVSVILIVLIMLQYQGRGANMGTSLGTSTSSMFINSNSSGNFIVRATTILAILFFSISLLLNNHTITKNSKLSEWENLNLPKKNEYLKQSVTHQTKSNQQASDIPQ